MSGLSEKMIDLEKEFIAQLSSLTENSPTPKWSPDGVELIYSPLEYAVNLHNQYLRIYCDSPRKIMFLGMNPGPYGMVQTGVPFGEVATVRDFLKITGEIEKPARFHIRRPVLGLECRRSEVSGKRLWGLIKELSGNDPSVFFRHCFVYNYCPLSLITNSGKNITPAELKANDQRILNHICDEYLYKTLELYEVEVIVAIGRYAEKRSFQVLEDNRNSQVKVIYIPHPSPQNIRSTNNWPENVKQLLRDENLIQYLQKNN